MLLAVFLRHQHFDALAGQLFFFISEDLQDLLVHQDDFPFRIGGDDALFHGVEHRMEQLDRFHRRILGDDQFALGILQFPVGLGQFIVDFLEMTDLVEEHIADLFAGQQADLVLVQQLVRHQLHHHIEGLQRSVGLGNLPVALLEQGGGFRFAQNVFQMVIELLGDLYQQVDPLSRRGGDRLVQVKGRLETVDIR